MKQIYHSWDKWECYKSGFYDTNILDNSNKGQCDRVFAEIIKNESIFEFAIERVFREWKYSCEHFLTNKSMNRVAWLGQASVCILTKISSNHKSGFKLLTNKEMLMANNLAKKKIREWEFDNAKNKSIFE